MSTESPESLCPEDFTGLKLTKPKQVAAGAKSVMASLQHVFGSAGFRRGIRTLSVLNQKGGVDCPSCAWPESDGYRSPTEFCENGAKAVAFEADTRRITPEFFAQHTVEDLAKFAIALQTGKLLKPESLNQAWTKQKMKDSTETAYGLGWALSEYKGMKEVAHGGNQARVTTYLYMLPERGFAVVLMMNLEGVTSRVELARQISDIVLQ